MTEVVEVGAEDEVSDVVGEVDGSANISFWAPE